MWEANLHWCTTAFWPSSLETRTPGVGGTAGRTFLQPLDWIQSRLCTWSMAQLQLQHLLCWETTAPHQHCPTQRTLAHLSWPRGFSFAGSQPELGTLLRGLCDVCSRALWVEVSGPPGQLHHPKLCGSNPQVLLTAALLHSRKSFPLPVTKSFLPEVLDEK